MNDIYVLNKNLEQIGIVDTYKSCIWANRYSEIGDCELYVEATTEKLDLLVKGNYLVRYDDDMICQIKKVELDTDSENGNYLIVTGYDVKRFLDQRVIWGTYSVDGNIEDYLREMINRSLGNPTLSARQLKKDNNERLFYLGDKANFTEVTTEQNSYKNVGELVRENCKKHNWGYKVVLSDKALYFKLYKGTDRSNSVIFSNEFENLEATKYIEDDSKLGNVALVAGQGEGSERSRNVSGYAEGVDRYEIYVDARDVSKNITWGELTKMYPTTDEGGHGYIYITSPQQAITYKMDIIDIQIVDSNQLTELKIAYPNGQVITKDGNTYYQIYDVIIADLKSTNPANSDSVILRDVVYSVYLLNRGYEKLAEYGSTTSFEGSVEPNTTFKYKQDYFLGDEVTVENEYGISTTARIIEVVEVHDDNGYSIEPKFEYIEDTIEPTPTQSGGLILTESSEAITTETGSRLLNEAVGEEITILTASDNPVETSDDIPNVKISQLQDVSEINDGCCMPIVSNGETRKITYGYLKNKLANDLPQTEVTVGTTTTGEPGTNASVVNSGTATNPILDFTIPKGSSQGVPTGGTTGQVLVKKTDTDYDTEWLDINGQVLYDNSTGTNETVTLSDSAANYDYLEIYFRTNDSTDYKSSTKVYSPNNALVPLSYPLVAVNGTAIYWKIKTVKVSGNSILSSDGNRYAESTIKATTSISQKNYVYITKVIGYHDTPKQVDTIPMSDVYYKSGDTLELTNVDIFLAGTVTGSTKNLYFSFVPPKRLTNISSITIDTLKANTRISGGGYLDNKAFVDGGVDYKTTYTCTADVMSDNSIRFTVTKSSAFTNTTNNIPVTVTIANLKLTFN